MAAIKLNAAIAALVEETQMAVVDRVITFLGEKIEVDDDMKAMFEEFKEVLKAENKEKAKAKKGKKASSGSESDGEKKRTRPASAYNLYIKDKMAEFKAAGNTGNLMKMAIEAWNADKAAGKIPFELKGDKKDKEIEPVVEEPEKEEKKGKGGKKGGK